MDKNLICIVFVVMFAGCCPPQEGAQAPTADSYAQEPPPDEDKPVEVDPETRAAADESYRRHPPSPMPPSLNRDPR